MKVLLSSVLNSSKRVFSSDDEPYMVESSVNKTVFNLVDTGRSFTYKIKSNGVNTEPCGCTLGWINFQLFYEIVSILVTKVTN